MPYTKQTYRWIMLTILWIVYFAFGLVSGSMAPLVTPIVRDLDMSYSQMGLILGSWQLVFIAASIVAGNVIDRWGERKSILAGALIATVSAVLRYFSDGFETMLVAVALLGAGMPMISVGGPKVISLWFEGKRRGTALGIYMTGAWIGSLAGLALTNSVVMPLTGNSWRIAFLSYGAVVLLAGLLWWFLARDVRPEMASKRVGAVRTLGGIVRIRNVQIMIAMGLLALATSHGMMNWLPKILETGGMSPAMAGFAASVNMFAGIPAVLFLPHLIPLHLRGRALALSALGVVIALVGIIATSGPVQLAALILLGFAGSAFLPIILLMLMDSSGIPTEYLGSANGVLLSVAQIGGFVAPLMMGVLFEATSGFLTGVLVLAALNLVMFALAFQLRTGSKQEPAYSAQREAG